MTEKDSTKLEETFQCPLCGYTFSQKEATTTCDTGTFRKHCGLIMCLRCDHEFLGMPL